MFLSKEKINTGRQVEIDLLKAFTVVFSMIIIHVFDYDTISFDNNFTWWLDTVFGGIFAAPVFMFCMGLGMVYSRNSDPRQTMIRGLKLLTIGQVLNLFRYALIFPVKALLESDCDFRPAQALNFSSDIMQLAGLSFILMGLLRKFELKNWVILIIAVVMNICGMLLAGVQTGCYAFDQFLGFFWGTDTESFFPLFNWFIFVAAGKCFGSFYKRLENKTVFYLVSAPLALMVFCFIWYFQKHTSYTIFNSFDHRGFSWMGLPDAISVILMMPLAFGIFYFLSRILPEKTIKVLSHPSKHINQYYCVSWWWIMVIYLDAWANSTEALMSVWLNVLTFTTITVVLYNNHLKDCVEDFCAKHKAVLMVLVWAITLGAAFYAFSVCTEFPNVFNDYLMD